MEKCINIIGDVAGRYYELLELLEKMPEADLTIYVGDLNDRHDESAKVIDHVMNDPKSICVRSNHGQMMVDYYDDPNCHENSWVFLHNGGINTILSYLPEYCREYSKKELESGTETYHNLFLNNIDLSHIKYLRDLPYFYEDEHLFVSHAPRNPNANKALLESAHSDGLLWNRGNPRPIEGKVQVFGHNSNWGLRTFEKGGKIWARCIDDSGKNQKLTGLHFAEGGDIQEIYQVDYHK